MIVVTGGAGLIGSAFVSRLNEEGIADILIVDNLAESIKWKNLVNLSYMDYLHKIDFLEQLQMGDFDGEIDAIVHMGACSSTTETDADYLMENNYRYTRVLAEWAIARNVRFIYASSAATYGEGEHGYSDNEDILQLLRPRNMYGYSKHVFDLWAIRSGAIAKLAGLKFFNVFGPNEYHKGSMRSMVQKAFEQVRDTGGIKLFKSYRDEYPDGGQKRDFVYVKDAVEYMWWLLNHPDVNGIFNIGTGQANTWNDLANAVFKAMGKEPNIEYIDMPDQLQGAYQYFTQAEMNKIKSAGCEIETHTLEDAIADYIRNYLMTDDWYL